MADKNLRNALIMLFVLFPITLAVFPLVTVKLWLWFAVPLGLPALSVAHAIGLRMLAGFFIPSPVAALLHYIRQYLNIPDSKNITVSDLKLVAGTNVGALFALLLGWILTCFM